MSKTITVSDELYAALERAAQQRGLSSVEQFLEFWQTDPVARQRWEAVERVNRIFEEMSAKYGMMPDSVELLREDRAR